jgi:hypothetical protein
MGGQFEVDHLPNLSGPLSTRKLALTFFARRPDCLLDI